MTNLNSQAGESAETLKASLEKSHSEKESLRMTAEAIGANPDDMSKVRFGSAISAIAKQLSGNGCAGLDGGEADAAKLKKHWEGLGYRHAGIGFDNGELRALGALLEAFRDKPDYLEAAQDYAGKKAEIFRERESLQEAAGAAREIKVGATVILVDRQSAENAGIKGFNLENNRGVLVVLANKDSELGAYPRHTVKKIEGRTVTLSPIAVAAAAEIQADSGKAAETAAAAPSKNKKEKKEDANLALAHKLFADLGVQEDGKAGILAKEIDGASARDALYTLTKQASQDMVVKVPLNREQWVAAGYSDRGILFGNRELKTLNALLAASLEENGTGKTAALEALEGSDAKGTEGSGRIQDADADGQFSANPDKLPATEKFSRDAERILAALSDKNFKNDRAAILRATGIAPAEADKLAHKLDRGILRTHTPEWDEVSKAVNAQARNNPEALRQLEMWLRAGGSLKTVETVERKGEKDRKVSALEKASFLANGIRADKASVAAFIADDNLDGFVTDYSNTKIKKGEKTHSHKETSLFEGLKGLPDGAAAAAPFILALRGADSAAAKGSDTRKALEADFAKAEIADLSKATFAQTAAFIENNPYIKAYVTAGLKAIADSETTVQTVRDEYDRLKAASDKAAAEAKTAEEKKAAAEVKAAADKTAAKKPAFRPLNIPDFNMPEFAPLKFEPISTSPFPKGRKEEAKTAAETVPAPTDAVSEKTKMSPEIEKSVKDQRAEFEKGVREIIARFSSEDTFDNANGISLWKSSSEKKAFENFKGEWSRVTEPLVKAALKNYDDNVRGSAEKGTIKTAGEIRACAGAYLELLGTSVIMERTKGVGAGRPKSDLLGNAERGLGNSMTVANAVNAERERALLENKEAAIKEKSALLKAALGEKRGLDGKMEKSQAEWRLANLGYDGSDEEKGRIEELRVKMNSAKSEAKAAAEKVAAAQAALEGAKK